MVEILVAVALIGIVVSIVYGSLAATTRSARVYGDRLSVTMKGHIALQQIAATLRCCCREVRSQESGVRILTTKAIIEDNGGEAGLFEVALRLDRVNRTLLVSEESWRPGSERDTALRTWAALLEGVTDLRWSFWDAKDWLSDWDSAARKGLPLLIRIEMELQDGHGRRYGLRTTVSPACAAKAQTATPEGVQIP